MRSESSIKYPVSKIALFAFACMVLFCDSAIAKSWHFVQWASDITIKEDSTFIVREKQTVEFIGQFSYLQRGVAIHNIKKISDIKVYDSSGNTLSPEISHSGNEVKIKINIQAQDEVNTYVFEYVVHGGIGFNEGIDELYWNAISEERSVPIDRVNVIVRFPQNISPSGIMQRLFVGATGTRNELPNHAIVDGHTLAYWGENIAPYTHFTIFAGFPKGIVEQSLWLVVSPYLWFLIPLSVFGLLVWRWCTGGRDPRTSSIIVPQKEPPEGLTPAEANAIIHQRVRTKEISATIVDLASRGHLKIVAKSGILDEVFLQRLGEASDKIPIKRHERLVLDGIFGFEEIVRLDDLENQFYRNIPDIVNAVFDQVTREGYFRSNPHKTKKKYLFFGIAILIIAIFLGMPRLLPVFGLMSLGFTGAIIMIFAWLMPCRTQKGAEAKWQALGFKEYLQITKKFDTESNMDPEAFDKYLGYAIIFDVADKWAERFSDIYKSHPDWYSSDYDNSGIFTTVFFVDSLSNTVDKFSSVLHSSPSSDSGSGGGDGGGSSGDGGGGGSSDAG